MEDDKINNLFKLDFYKKQKFWVHKKTSHNPIVCDGNDTMIDSKVPVGTSENEVDATLVPNTVKPTAVSPISTTAKSTDASDESNDIERRYFSNRLELFLKLSNEITDSNTKQIQVIDSSEDHSHVAIDTSPVSGEMKFGLDTTDSGGVASEINFSMLKLHTQEDVLDGKSDFDIDNLDSAGNISDDVAYDAEASTCYEHEILGEQTHNDWMAMYRETCAGYGYSTSFDPMPNETMDSFVSFMREIHDAPHSSTLDLNYNMSNMLIQPYNLTKDRLAEMSPSQLEANICHVSEAWKKMMKEANERSIHKRLRAESYLASVLAPWPLASWTGSRQYKPAVCRRRYSF